MLCLFFLRVISFAMAFHHCGHCICYPISVSWCLGLCKPFSPLSTLVLLRPAEHSQLFTNNFWQYWINYSLIKYSKAVWVETFYFQMLVFSLFSYLKLYLTGYFIYLYVTCNWILHAVHNTHVSAYITCNMVPRCQLRQWTSSKEMCVIVFKMKRYIFSKMKINKENKTKYRYH